MRLHSKSKWFLGGISHTHSQRQRYLFIHLFVYENEVVVTWFLVWVFRREKTGFQYTVSRLCLFFADFEDFSRCAISSQGK